MNKPIPSDLPQAEIQAQLDKILSSEEFSQSESLQRFLRYVVERTLEGHGDELKEYNVGVDVLGRGESYDPRTDTIVRVQAGRLRSKLHEYYRAHGRSDPVRIEIPKGSYVPDFQRMSKKSDAAAVGTPRDRKLVPLTAVVVLYSARKFGDQPEEWQRYHASAHTSTIELAAIATRATPGLLILYHQLFWGADPKDLLKEIREGYRGRVASGRDLDVYE